jgi:hypothetical protein
LEHTVNDESVVHGPEKARHAIPPLHFVVYQEEEAHDPDD